MKPESSATNNRSLLSKYAGLSMQFLVTIGIMVFIGIKADHWLNFKIPLLVWVLPLLVIIAMIWQVVKDTSKK